MHELDWIGLATGNGCNMHSTFPGGIAACMDWHHAWIGLDWIGLNWIGLDWQHAMTATCIPCLEVGLQHA